ncbi:hypothetical protein AVEN_272345-1 [Araneus ventricosus]|uniref:CCHC-type domain-containing protein n=1 Tax=Araneus ventricosus TaxID=182803 RepID=A0A4Y2GR35_ARAVE|nr:hypothetical protein AVEN_272345-1 [Araneus ventricosus]
MRRDCFQYASKTRRPKCLRPYNISPPELVFGKQPSFRSIPSLHRHLRMRMELNKIHVSPRELVYYTVRDLQGKFVKVRDILKTQRDKSIDEVLEILREEETSFISPSSTRAEGTSADVFYSRKYKNFGMRLCYVCRRPNHVAKDCFYRNQKESTTSSQRRKVNRNKNSKERNTANPVFTDSPNEESLCENIWILDSGISCHMAKDRVWFEKKNT